MKNLIQKIDLSLPALEAPPLCSDEMQHLLDDQHVVLAHSWDYCSGTGSDSGNVLLLRVTDRKFVPARYFHSMGPDDSETSREVTLRKALHYLKWVIQKRTPYLDGPIQIEIRDDVRRQLVPEVKVEITDGERADLLADAILCEQKRLRLAAPAKDEMAWWAVMDKYKRVRDKALESLKRLRAACGVSKDRWIEDFVPWDPRTDRGLSHEEFVSTRRPRRSRRDRRRVRKRRRQRARS